MVLPEPATPWMTRWPVAQAARQLLLLQVHHAHDVGQLVLRVVGRQTGRAAGWHAHFGEHDPAHAVESAAATGRRASWWGTCPTAGSGSPRPPRVSGISSAQITRCGSMASPSPACLELSARDVGEHHAVAPREGQLALVRAVADCTSCGSRCQRVDHLDGRSGAPAPAGWARSSGMPSGTMSQRLPVGLADGVEPPVLHLQDQQAAPRVQDDEVGMSVLRADRHVVPERGSRRRASARAVRRGDVRPLSCARRRCRGLG